MVGMIVGCDKGGRTRDISKTALNLRRYCFITRIMCTESEDIKS